MPFWRFLALPPALAVALFACGRTSPPDAQPPSGSGGAGPVSASSTTASTGGGGSGGSVPDIECPALVMVGDPITLEGPAGFAQQNPQLVIATVDGSAVTAFFALSAFPPPPSPPPKPLRQATFEPWPLWPSGTSIPSRPVDDAGGNSFAAGPSGANHTAVLFSHYLNPPMPPEGMFIAPAVNPVVDGSGPTQLVSPDATQALFVASEGDEFLESPYLLGFYRPGAFPGSFELNLGFAYTSNNSITYDGPYPESCAMSPPAADAIATNQGWMLAFSKGLPFHNGCLDDVPPGPITGIQTVTRHDEDGLWYFGDDIPVSQSVSRIELVRRTDGGWLVWSAADGQGNVAPISVARLDTDALVALPPFEIIALDEVPLAFGADHIGNLLALAYVSDTMGNPADIVVQIIGSQGQMLAKAQFEPSWFGGQLAVLGSTVDKSVLVAWSQQAIDAPRVVVARFDCVSE